MNNTPMYTTIRYYKNVKLYFISFYASKPIIKIEMYSPNPHLTPSLNYKEFLINQHQLGINKDEIKWLLSWKSICNLFYNIPHKVTTLSPHRAHCIIPDHP